MLMLTSTDEGVPPERLSVCFFLIQFSELVVTISGVILLGY